MARRAQTRRWRASSKGDGQINSARCSTGTCQTSRVPLNARSAASQIAPFFVVEDGESEVVHNVLAFEK